jgi:hypothetical protein
LKSLCAGFSIVNRQSSIHTGGAGQHLFNPPSFSRTQRTRFDNAHAVTDLTRSILIVRQKLGGFPLNLLVKDVLHQPVNGDRYGLLHGRTGYGANLAFAESSFLFSTHLYPY